MSIVENVSLAMQKHREITKLSIHQLSKELDLPASSIECYLKGKSDLRASTIELLAEKTKIPLIEMVFGPLPEWESAEAVARAARKFSDLPEEKRDQGIQLFLQLAALFTEDA